MPLLRQTFHRDHSSSLDGKSIETNADAGVLGGDLRGSATAVGGWVDVEGEAFVAVVGDLVASSEGLTLVVASRAVVMVLAGYTVGNGEGIGQGSHDGGNDQDGSDGELHSAYKFSWGAARSKA